MGRVTASQVQALARRIEAAQALAIEGSARALAARRRLARVRSIAGGWAVFAGAGLPLNRAVGLGMNGPVTAGDLDEVERFYQEVGALPQVDACPYADDSLMALLGARGYTPLRFFSVLVKALPADVPAAGDANTTGVSEAAISVECVGASRGELWARVTAQAFTGRESVAADDTQLVMARAAAAQPEVRCYLARSGDTPVGVGALRLHEGCAIFFSAATMPAFRRRGVQAALVAARLAAAEEAGCDLAVALPLPGSDSERNLERAGFRSAYTRLVTVRRG